MYYLTIYNSNSCSNVVWDNKGRQDQGCGCEDRDEYGQLCVSHGSKCLNYAVIPHGEYIELTNLLRLLTAANAFVLLENLLCIFCFRMFNDSKQMYNNYFRSL